MTDNGTLRAEDLVPARSRVNRGGHLRRRRAGPCRLPGPDTLGRGLGPTFRLRALGVPTPRRAYEDHRTAVRT